MSQSENSVLGANEEQQCNVTSLPADDSISCYHGMWAKSGVSAGGLNGLEDLLGHPDELSAATEHCRPWLADTLIVKNHKAMLLFHLFSGWAWRILSSQSCLNTGVSCALSFLFCFQWGCLLGLQLSHILAKSLSEVTPDKNGNPSTLTVK